MMAVSDWRGAPIQSPLHRRCIIVGTTNRTDVLPNDPSGNRRFVPVLLNPAARAVEDYMAFHRDSCCGLRRSPDTRMGTTRHSRARSTR